MIYYTYKITHIGGKYYVGRHSTDNLEDGYMGSGIWPKSIKDKTSLRKEILLFYPDEHTLVEAEKNLLEEHIKNPLCMNFNNNPVGFASGELNPAKSDLERKRRSERYRGDKNPMYGKRHSDFSRAKMSKSRKGKPTWNKGLSGIKTSDKGQMAWNKGLKTGYKSFTGKKHSEHSIELMKAKHAEREQVPCTYCGRTLDKPNYTRYHGNKCKFYTE